MKTKPMTLEERIKMIRRALGVFVEVDAVAEMRIPQSDDGPQSGLFDDLDEMAEAAANASSKVPGVFFTLNPVKPSLKDRVKNRLTTGTSAVKDADIDRRRGFLVDFDPVRASKSPATEPEHEDAIATAKECRDDLRQMGWPEPVMADSGN